MTQAAQRCPCCGGSGRVLADARPRPMQQPLRLRWGLDEQMRQHAARAFWCSPLRVRVLPETCAQRQAAPEGRHPTCARGRCMQGLEVLRSLGLVERVVCPECAGSGRVRGARLGA